MVEAFCIMKENIIGSVNIAPDSGFVTEKGINCYSSTDLLNWNYEGVVLPISEAKGSDIEKGASWNARKLFIISRPENS